VSPESNTRCPALHSLVVNTAEDACEDGAKDEADGAGAAGPAAGGAGGGARQGHGSSWGEGTFGKRARSEPFYY
jgi:hypothetical protein